MNNTYKKLCYRLLGKYIEGSSLENEFSLTLHQAEINIRGSMFLSVLFVSSLLLALAIGGILYILSIELINYRRGHFSIRSRFLQVLSFANLNH